MKLGSLFDGSGGFPLSGVLCGIEPRWASEVEPYPIAVTKSRFPNMKHLGSVTDVRGCEIEPVDIITFGSPCQDLSVAGKRAGLKHEANGDEETTRSGLFMEAVRIIKEMREATNGEYPTFALWENVPGAFSSNRGEDFKIVLEELIKIVEPDAVMPAVPKAGWAYADCYVGDGWSIAYRAFDAQYWGVPQRRRRIYLVADFRGERAGEVLFERQGLRWHTPQIREARESTPAHAERSIATDDCTGDRVAYSVQDRAGKPGGGKGMLVQENLATSLRTSNYQYIFQPIPINDKATRYKGGGASRSNDGAGNGLGVGQPGDRHAVFCIEGNGARPSHLGDGYSESDTMYTLNTIERHAVCYAMQGFGHYKENEAASGLKARGYKDATDLVCEPYVAGVDVRNGTEHHELYPTLQAKPNGGQSLNFSGALSVQYIVRRLTPTECARLQGFADRWGHPDHKDDLTDEEYKFWLDVRNTHAAVNGKATKEYTKDQILTWYNKLHTDSSEYKLWGNGIALPTALYVMQGIEDALRRELEA